MFGLMGKTFSLAWVGWISVIRHVGWEVGYCGRRPGEVNKVAFN